MVLFLRNASSRQNQNLPKRGKWLFYQRLQQKSGDDRRKIREWPHRIFAKESIFFRNAQGSSWRSGV